MKLSEARKILGNLINQNTLTPVLWTLLPAEARFLFKKRQFPKSVLENRFSLDHFPLKAVIVFCTPANTKDRAA